MKKSVIDCARLIIPVFIVVLYLYLEYSLGVIVFDKEKSDARLKIEQIFNAVELGDTSAISVDKISKVISPSQKFQVFIEDTSIVVAAPVELPGFTTSWILKFQLANSLVIGKGIGTRDGWIRPCGAPQDVGQISRTKNDSACVN